jgi:hypothetical protein
VGRLFHTLGIGEGEDHSGTNRVGGMELLVIIMFSAIGIYVQYWIIRLAVRHALEDADERRDGFSPDPE